jgi:hypothetical protein
MTPTTLPTALATIERDTRLYEEARLLLQQRVAAYNEGLAALASEHMPGVRRALNKAADIEARLREVVTDNPGVFVKPRTLVLHGTKVGYQKAKGKIGFDKPERVVERIKRLMPEQADILIHKEEKPNKEALAKLPAADLKRLGCTVTDGGDEVVVKPIDGEVDKIVKAMLKAAADAAGADEADAEPGEAS